MSRLEDAIRAYSRAIEINPRYARAYANRGNIWRKMDERENAIADYRHGLTLDGRNTLALAGLKTLGVSANAAASTGPAGGSPSRSDPFDRGPQVARSSPPAAPRHRPWPRAKKAAARAPDFSCRRKATS